VSVPISRAAVRCWLCLLLVLPTAALAQVGQRDSLDALARRFAPVLRQDTASEQDYITNFDFDGDWRGSNNWENQPEFPLRAYVYWSGIETETHAFLLYAWFHPRDYGRWQSYGSLFGSTGAHENDLEGALLVVEKDEGEDRLVVAETVFHTHLLKYTIDPRYPVRSALGARRVVRAEGERLVLQIEARGHGVEAWDGADFPGGDGVIYRLGDTAGVPSGQNDRDVRYELVDIESTLWAKRFDVGDGSTYGATGRFGDETLGYLFAGDNYDEGKAKAPWGWSDEKTPLPMGTIFFDPARLVRTHFETPVPMSSSYAPNPFTSPRSGE